MINWCVILRDMMSRKKQQKAKIKTKTKAKTTTYFFVGGFLIVLVVVIYGIASSYKTNSTFPSKVNVKDAYQMRESGAFVLDVREQSEWDEAHIPDTTLIPLGELERRLDEVPKEQEIIVVCRTGNRSAKARDILLAAGFKKVASMTGGMNAWKLNKFETVSEN